MDGKTVVLYASGLGGHVRKVAGKISEKIGADTVDLKKQENVDLSAYDRLIFGTGVHAGRPYRKVTSFIEAHSSEIKGKTTILYICCMYNDEKGEKQCKAIAEKYGIGDAVFFPDSTDDESGLPSGLDRFIERL